MHTILRNRLISGVNISCWMTKLLIAAGLYNFSWAIFIAFYPQTPFQMMKLGLLRHPISFWCFGSAIAIFGVGFLVAAREPLRYWPIVMVGLMAKVVGPVGFTYLALKNPDLWSIGWVVVLNDVVWWPLFGMILAAAYRERCKIEGCIEV